MSFGLYTKPKEEDTYSRHGIALRYIRPEGWVHVCVCVCGANGSNAISSLRNVYLVCKVFLGRMEWNLVAETVANI